MVAIALTGLQTYPSKLADSQWRRPPMILVPPTSAPSPADYDGIGEALTNKTDWIRLKAQIWLEEYCPPGSFPRRTAFTYRSPSGVQRRVDVERAVARGSYHFAYWVLEGENQIDEGGYWMNACG